jgi:hypothetical protein
VTGLKLQEASDQKKGAQHRLCRGHKKRFKLEKDNRKAQTQTAYLFLKFGISTFFKSLNQLRALDLIKLLFNLCLNQVWTAVSVLTTALIW